MPTAEIEHLEINLRNCSPRVARSLVDGLGNEMLMELARRQGQSKDNRTIDIGRIDVGISLAPGELQEPGLPNLRRTIADKILDVVITNAK